MSLWSVFFTTKKIVSTTAPDGRIVENQEDIRQVILGIPRRTAEGYRDCDNFEIERYIPEILDAKQRDRYRKAVEVSKEFKVIEPKTYDSYETSGPSRRTKRDDFDIDVDAQSGNLAAGVSTAG